MNMCLFAFTDSPKNTHVLVSPRGEIREGTSVNLSCVCLANPPASRYQENYYKPSAVEASDPSFTCWSRCTELMSFLSLFVFVTTILTFVITLIFPPSNSVIQKNL